MELLKKGLQPVKYSFARVDEGGYYETVSLYRAARLWNPFELRDIDAESIPDLIEGGIRVMVSLDKLENDDLTKDLKDTFCILPTCGRLTLQYETIEYITVAL